MNDRLAQLRMLARLLEPDPQIRRAWSEKVNAHAELFMSSLPTAPAFRSTPHEGKGILSSPLTEEPQDPDRLLQLLAEQVEQPGVRLGAPGFLGFIPISSLYPAALGDYLAAVVILSLEIFLPHLEPCGSSTSLRAGWLR